jgi:hypothetical protein
VDSSFAAQNLSLAFPLQSRLYLRVMETIQIARDNSDSEQASQMHQLIHASVAFSYDFGFDIWPSTPIGPRARLDILNNRSRGMGLHLYQQSISFVLEISSVPFQIWLRIKRSPTLVAPRSVGPQCCRIS